MFGRRSARASKLHLLSFVVLLMQLSHKAAEAEANCCAATVFPSAISSNYAEDSPAKARMHTCLDQYNANKTNNGNGGMHWIEKGGGYYSECNRRMKEKPMPVVRQTGPDASGAAIMKHLRCTQEGNRDCHRYALEEINACAAMNYQSGSCDTSNIIYRQAQCTNKRDKICDEIAPFSPRD